MNSINEAAAKGAPILCIPLFADQMRNCKMAQYRGIGVIVKKKNFNSHILTEAIRKITAEER